MRIENNQNLKLFNKVVNQPSVEIEKKQVSLPEQNDSYQFNINADELNEFFKLASESMVVRDDVIEAFKEKYEAGEYHVTGKDVINKLMEERYEK